MHILKHEPPGAVNDVGLWAIEKVAEIMFGAFDSWITRGGLAYRSLGSHRITSRAFTLIASWCRKVESLGYHARLLWY
jgi:hypothetical protein